MKILCSWLRDYIDAEIAPKDLRAYLTRIGLKTEGISRFGFVGEGVIVGRVRDVSKHPNAEKLFLCEVETGGGVKAVVCGAQNVAAGQLVPFAPVGARLSGGIIKRARLRGVWSEGMICSASELGLEDGKSAGIMVLPETVGVGTDAAGALPPPDDLLELEMLPNYAHCLSHFGVARELCAFFGLPLKTPDWPEFNPKGDEGFPIKIEDDRCPRYFGVVVSGVGGAKTPGWMAARLRAMGTAPKGNLLIDASNYVLFDIGQPTHCFDLSQLHGSEIRVRGARAGEEMVSLDGHLLKLEEPMLVIADEDRPVALAGVIGGREASVTDSTSEILIESARFDPPSVRKAAQRAGVKTESSYRFERGIDPACAELGARRMVRLITGCIPEAVVLRSSKAGTAPDAARTVEVSAKKIGSILGTPVQPEKIVACLKALQPGFDSATPWRFAVPSYRLDIESQWDLAEEVARFIGYDAIPAESSMGMMLSATTRLGAVRTSLRERLVSNGLIEVFNHDFLSASEADACLTGPAAAVEVSNPLSSDYRFLRTTMIVGLMRTLKYNLNRGRESVDVFEIGTVFGRVGRGHRESEVCAGLLVGTFPPGYTWKSGAVKADFYHLKGLVESLLDGFSEVSLRKPRSVPGYFQEGMTLEVTVKGEGIGHLGLLDPLVSDNFDVNEPQVCYFEIFMPPLARLGGESLRQRVEPVRPISLFPTVSRDLSVVLPVTVDWAEIKETLGRPPLLVSLRLIDVYCGSGISPSEKSISIRFVFGSMEKTLTGAEVSAEFSKIMEKLSAKFRARVRGAQPPAGECETGSASSKA